MNSKNILPVDKVVTPNQSATHISRRHLLGTSVAIAGAMGMSTRLDLAHAQDGETPGRGGTAHVACSNAVTSLDPLSSLLGSGDRVCYASLYETLIAWEQDGSFSPELATEWDVSEDGLTFTFQIREGVTFHDGTELDANAVKFNLDRYRAEGSTYPGLQRLEMISEVSAKDGETLTVTLMNPSATFLTGLSFVPIVSPAAVEQLGEDFQLQGVGSGPFEYASWTPGASATLRRFEGYWQQAPDGQPLPYLDEIVVEAVPDDAVRLINLQGGQFDLMDLLNPRDVETARSDPQLQVMEAFSGTGYRVAMNPNKAPFDNKVLRQAASAALNRQAIIDNVSFGSGYLSPLGFARDTWFFFDEPSPEYDPERAVQLLTEAGYPDGIDVNLSIINRPVDNQIAQIVAENLNEVGIRTNIEVLERTTWVEQWTTRQGEIGILEAGGGAIDPGFFAASYEPESFTNFAGYESEPVLELVEQQAQSMDQDERIAIWKEIAAIVIDDAVYVQIGIVPAFDARSDSLKNVEIHPDFYFLLDEAWIAE